ncbi:epimerase [Streptomyces sp. 150FB]|uniref:NAD-dependent epimerase/dehydratase family protein n=1 Tax=Streptomyces sp. 150FB TaxID=1576605 RepID=UPI0005893EAC|nr:NAD-dependent epimerase/dehydratase family protein [Streptomyces sp. 150FB]KIF77416.1 epimerase [Streptomyces sp. 150FB]
MKVIVFGASGMVGQGVLRECVLDDQVESVLLVSRRATSGHHPKVREIVHEDFTDLSAIEGELTGLDACFFCLGVSAAGRSEEEYRTITHDYPLAAARALASNGRELTFVYVSGEGTDSTERGRSMWARVKGRTENELLAMDLRAYMFRPGYIQPRNGATSRTPMYRVLYGLTAWLYPVLRRLLPKQTTTTEHLGRAMLAVVGLRGEGPHILHSPEINRLGT